MDRSLSLVRPLAAALLLGTLLLAAGAVVHPVLPHAAAAQLRMIADFPHWRTVHLLMLAGSGLVAAGIWVRLLLDGPDVAGSSGVMVGALALIAVGITLNTLNIAFMAGAGTQMAALYREGDTAIVRVFESTHPIGLMAARFGNFLAALGALVLGALEWERAHSRTGRLLALLAWAAAAGGLAGALVFDEASRLALAAVALLAGWQVVVGVIGLRSPGRSVTRVNRSVVSDS